MVYVSQLERGTKEAKGSVRALLNVIRHKGIEVVYQDFCYPLLELEGWAIVQRCRLCEPHSSPEALA